MPKTLPEKFFIKEGYEIAVLNAPQMFFTKQFAPLPKDATVTTQLNQGPYDVIIAFVTTASETAHFLQPVRQAMKPGSFVWFCYPKGGIKAKIATDMNRDSLAELVMESGLRPVHQMSIDGTWSGLRFRVDSKE